MALFCKLFDHKWNGCKCSRCGAVRDWEHRWIGCVCKTCGKKRDMEHEWRNSCTCRACGKVRDEWHRYKNGRCEVCGQAMNAAKMAEEIRRQYAARNRKPQLSANQVAWSSVDDLACNLVSQAQNGLEKREADDVLLAWMLALVYDGVWDNEIMWESWRERNALKLFPIRSADVSTMLRLFTAIHADDTYKNRYWSQIAFGKLCEIAQTEQTDPAQAIAACREAGLDDARTKDFLRAIHVADGALVTPCEAGRHEWERVQDEGDSGPDYGSGSGEEYDWGPRSTTVRYRCRICGATQERTQRRW